MQSQNLYDSFSGSCQQLRFTFPLKSHLSHRILKNTPNCFMMHKLSQQIIATPSHRLAASSFDSSTASEHTASGKKKAFELSQPTGQIPTEMPAFIYKSFFRKRRGSFETSWRLSFVLSVVSEVEKNSLQL